MTISFDSLMARQSAKKANRATLNRKMIGALEDAQAMIEGARTITLRPRAAKIRAQSSVNRSAKRVFDAVSATVKASRVPHGG